MGHILMLVTNGVEHDPRVRAQAGALVAAGHAVSIIGWNRNGGERRLELDGAAVHLLGTTRSMRLRGLDLFRLPQWRRHAVRAALRVHEEQGVDAVHAHDLDTLAAGVELRKRLGAKLVFDAHEIWAYMVAKDLPSPVWPHFLRVERRLVPHADMVLTVSEPLAEHFRALTTAPVEIILNAKQPTGRFVEPKVPFRAVHIGGLNPTRMTLGILDAFDGLSDAELLLAGVGAPGFIAHVQERAARLANVRYLGKIPMADVLMQTLAGHVVVCPFDPSDPLTRIGMPNKLFEALACGRPLITTTDTYLGALVEELEIGIACGFDAASLRAAIEELRDDKMSWRRMAKRAHALGKGEYGWPRQAQRLNELYAALLKVQS